MKEEWTAVGLVWFGQARLGTARSSCQRESWKRGKDDAGRISYTRGLIDV